MNIYTLQESDISKEKRSAKPQPVGIQKPYTYTIKTP